MVDVCRVIEHGQEDAEDAHCGDSNGDGRYDPVNRRITRPAKPEQTEWHEGGFNAGEQQTAFWATVHFVGIVLHCPMFLPDAQGGRNDGANAHGREDGSCLLQTETVIDFKDERYRAKLEIQNGPGEGYPETEPEHDGLGKEHMHRPVKR